MIQLGPNKTVQLEPEPSLQQWKAQSMRGDRTQGWVEASVVQHSLIQLVLQVLCHSLACQESLEEMELARPKHQIHRDLLSQLVKCKKISKMSHKCCCYYFTTDVRFDWKLVFDSQSCLSQICLHLPNSSISSTIKLFTNLKNISL